MTTPSPCSCIICHKLTSNLGISSHYGLRHSNGKMFEKFTAKGNAARKGAPSWNAGLKTSVEQKKKLSEANLNHYVSPETRTKISATAKENGKSGGVRKGGGRGKKGYYKGIYCDSSWELAFAICMIADGKDIKRVNEPRLYIFNGKVRKYFPDFCVDGTVIEIKGWKTAQSIAKEEQHRDVLVLQWNEIKPMMQRAKDIVGENIIAAYE